MKKTYTNKYSTGGGQSNHKRITSRLKGAIKEILGDSTSLFLLGIFLLVSLVSIGYSALSSSLMVTGEANFRVREDVRITGLKVLSTSNSGGETYPSEYYKDGTKVMVTLPNLNSTITYQVEVTNNTKVDYYLKSKTDATNSNTSMQYTLSGAMNEQSPIKANTKSTFNIVISYKSGISLPSNKNLTLETRYIFDVLDATPPTVIFSPVGGKYTGFQTVRITASDEHYDHMDVEVRNGKNEKIAGKSKTGIVATTFDVSLDSYGTYKILVKAYDKSGNTQTNTPLENGYTYQQYVIQEPGVNFAEYLKSRANSSSITSYTNGNKNEMYTFSHSSTSQTGSLTDYRYIGNAPNNYVQFNNELWRIIGVFSVENESGQTEERVKIIRANSLKDDMVWDSKGVNNWTNASLNTYLNETYLKNLSGTAKEMVEKTKYYLGGDRSEEELNGEDYYKFERGNTVYSNSPKYWVGNIGLMYPSDYVYTYALGVDNTCYTDAYNCGRGNNDKGIPSAGWMYNSNISEGKNSVTDQWTINPSQYNGAFMIQSIGYAINVAVTGPNYSVALSRSVRPVLYLSTSTTKYGGTGSSSDPYQIDVPPVISFDQPSGTYFKKPMTISITAADADYSHMNVEVRNSNGRIENKSKNDITENTYTVTLDEDNTYTISVAAYDKNGHVTQDERQYVINNNFVFYLKSKANADTVTSYSNGNKTEMFTFKHETTEQTGALTDYRYIGNTPNNYVYFNCTKDNDVSTCETWRVIGVFSVDDGKGNWQERMKIIKDTPIGYRVWDNDSNNWTTADLMTYLKDTYLNSLSATAKSMITDTKYYLGGNTSSSINGESFYKFERGTTTPGGSPSYWIGKIGLIYPSDYVYTYALGVNSTCYNSGWSCSSSSSGWLSKGAAEWTIFPYTGSTVHAFGLAGMVANTYGVTGSAAVRPVLYLSSSISIVDGDGSSTKPYQMAI